MLIDVEALDMTTRALAYQAFMLSPPIVADFDGDGAMEIIVGSGIGFVYALNAKGTVLILSWSVSLYS